MCEKNTLICMMGLPRSGKSTAARALGYPMVCRDSVRLALHGRPYLTEAEDMVTVLTAVMVKALFLAGHETVILDATHIKRKYRDACRSDKWDTVFYYIPERESVCKQRALEVQDDIRDSLIATIERMARDFEPLEPDEVKYVC